MTGKEFLSHCVMQGGNWTAMLMSGIRDAFPEYYEKMPDKDYSFEEVVECTRECGVVWEDKNGSNNARHS